MRLIENDAKFLRPNLDVLFIALNPPVQSNNEGHYFSGKQSLFFKQLYSSGLILEDLDKTKADDLIFVDNRYNYKNKEYGVIDLIPHLEETDSSRVKVSKKDVQILVDRLEKYKPKNICIIHSKVIKELERFFDLELDYGYNGRIFQGIESQIYCNYFPNGNNIKSEVKVKIYQDLKKGL